ncbi:secreted protein [methanotrophic bacterial endosymbiont of Bathymodiolus sp.]|nr:secreted protein [methanotrophic bacterial endosymbiont of Bathymodiolus sp.]
MVISRPGTSSILSNAGCNSRSASAWAVVLCSVTAIKSRPLSLAVSTTR